MPTVDLQKERIAAYSVETVSFYQLMNAHDANSTILFPVIFLNHMHVVTEDANNCYVFREKANLPKTSTCIAVGTPTNCLVGWES